MRIDLWVHPDEACPVSLRDSNANETNVGLIFFNLGSALNRLRRSTTRGFGPFQDPFVEKWLKAATNSLYHGHYDECGEDANLSFKVVDWAICLRRTGEISRWWEEWTKREKIVLWEALLHEFMSHKLSFATEKHIDWSNKKVAPGPFEKWIFSCLLAAALTVWKSVYNTEVATLKDCVEGFATFFVETLVSVVTMRLWPVWKFFLNKTQF